jgi:ribosomal protein S6
MRKYDLTFIVATDVPEDEHPAITAQLTTWIEELKGSVNNVEPMGRRKFAYDIGAFTEGFYVALDVQLEPKDIAPLERNLKLYTKVLRYLITLADIQ